MPMLISLLLAWALPSPGIGARPFDERAGFVTLLGRDTVALESFERGANRVEGDIVLRIPGTVRFHYRVELGADGSLARTVMEMHPLGLGALPERRVTLVLTRDSVRETVDSAGQRRVAMHAAAPGMVALFMTGFGASYGLYNSIGMYELALARSPAGGPDTMRVNAIDPLTARVSRRRFVRRSPTAVDADYFGIAWNHLTLDADGRILAVDASETTEKTMSARTGAIDVSGAARAFAARDRNGSGLGMASPNTSVSAQVGGQLVAITYGSPRRRARAILGAVVPYDRVWRTGANEATALVTDRDLDVGGVRVPAGAYTLWTIPHRDAVELVINRQHGQWGTSYDSTQDLGRVRMKTSVARTPVENLAITLDGTDRARELRIAWDTFVWSVPVTVR